jgi:hypothetical protein
MDNIITLAHELSGSTKIMSFVHTDNVNRLVIWKSVGMIPRFYRIEKTNLINH